MRAFQPQRLLAGLLIVGLFVFSGRFLAQASFAEDAASQSQQRIAASVKYLSSDELEGRGIGTDGLNKAADYISAEFQKMGLNTSLFDGQPFQKFVLTVNAKLGPKEKNHLALVGPAEKEGGKPKRIELEVGTAFNTLAVGGTGQFDASLVYVGYGITAKDLEYDDYAGVDVKGKVVLILRKEPQQGNPHSKFNGTDNSPHSYFTRKISNAYQHEAAAVILINDHFGLDKKRTDNGSQWESSVDSIMKLREEFNHVENPTPEHTTLHRKAISELIHSLHALEEKEAEGFDHVLTFNEAGQGTKRRTMPVYFCSRASVEPIIKASLGKELSVLEAEIDKSFKPNSSVLTGWKATGESSVVINKADVKNVIAVLEGEGPLADETVIVGAHYDHLGKGGAGSLAPWTSAIHNGADDNASGSAALLEVARRFASADKKPRRRIVFMAFTGEEKGLLGSAHYVREPRFPLEKTVAMVNMDMVGRLHENKLIVHGTGTAARFDSLIDRLNKKHEFAITKKPSGVGPSDHSSFYLKKIPVLHIFTGTHKDYHRPSDDFDKLNLVGMRRITDMVEEIVANLVETEERPLYQQTKQPKRADRGGSRPYFGSIPDFSNAEEGYALMGVAPKSPAEKGGLKAGDVIIKVGNNRISGLEDFDLALRKFKAGDKVKVVYLRNKEKQEAIIKVTAPR